MRSPRKFFLGVGGREKNFQGGLRVNLGPVVVVVVVVVLVVVADAVIIIIHFAILVPNPRT